MVVLARHIGAGIFMERLLARLRNVCAVIDRRRHAARRTTAALKGVVAMVARECGAKFEREQRIDLVRRVRHKAGRVCTMHGHVDCLVTLPGGERVYIELDRAEKAWSRRKLQFCGRQLGATAVWIRWRGRVCPTPPTGVCVVDMGGKRMRRKMGLGASARGNESVRGKSRSGRHGRLWWGWRGWRGMGWDIFVNAGGSERVSERGLECGRWRVPKRLKRRDAASTLRAALQAACACGTDPPRGRCGRKSYGLHCQMLRCLAYEKSGVDGAGGFRPRVASERLATAARSQLRAILECERASEILRAAFFEAALIAESDFKPKIEMPASTSIAA